MPSPERLPRMQRLADAEDRLARRWLPWLGAVATVGFTIALLVAIASGEAITAAVLAVLVLMWTLFTWMFWRVRSMDGRHRPL